MARHGTHVFKRNAGHWVHFKGNPFKKHHVRGRNPFKHNVAIGHYDSRGRFHRRKNIAAFYDSKGVFHPIRSGIVKPKGAKKGHPSRVKYRPSATTDVKRKGGKKKGGKRKKSKRK